MEPRPGGRSAARRSTCWHSAACARSPRSAARTSTKLFLSLDRAYSQGEAAGIISLVLGISIAGRLLMGWLADRMPRKHVMLIIIMLVATAIPLLLLRPSSSTMYVFAAIFGLGLGGEYLIIPLMAGELFGVAALGRVMGIVLTADGVAEATAPMLVGYRVTTPASPCSSAPRWPARSPSACCPVVANRWPFPVPSPQRPVPSVVTMRIVDGKVNVCSPGRNFVTLKLVTEDGVHGVGDATLNGRELAVASYLNDHVLPLRLAATRGASRTSGSISTRAPTGAAGR